MPSIGRNVLQPSSGIPNRLTADGNPQWKVGGITIDWTTVAAPVAAVILPSDQLTIPAGSKYLACGQFMTRITASGLFGPYDPAATDGRQLLNRGDVVVLDRTLLLNGILGFSVTNTALVGGIEGGTVWYDALIQAGTGTASLAAGPTQAAYEAVLPRLSYAKL